MAIKQTKIWKFFSSIKLAIWLLVVIALLSLLGTLIPQNEEPAAYIARYSPAVYKLLLTTGLYNLYSAWWFISLIVLFSLNLVICIINRFSLKVRTIGTQICHISVLVILLGALIGMLYGQKGYVKVSKGEEVNYFISQGREVKLGFLVRLDDFIYSENIDPKEKLLVYSSQGEKVCKLNESEPLPQKELQPIDKISTEAGVEQEIANTGYKVKILSYVPDFIMDMTTKEVMTRSAQPNNPAIEVELEAKDGAKNIFWVFARYPNFSQQIAGKFNFVYYWVGRRPKDFVSKVTLIKDNREALKKDIRVNSPLEFEGYSFFQYSYDTEHLNWTGLKVVKDPGVGVVYLGFILLILGLIIKFYISPFIR